MIVKNDCEFKHALKAIEASHGAYISITDCNFSNNVLAVKLGGASIGNVKQPVYFTSGGGIWGNNITGGALKSPYLGNRGLAGISCENISEMTIGNNTQRTNDFHDILRNFSDLTYIENCSGIYARNSDLTIIKTKFSNIGLRFNSNDDPNKEDAAISAINKSKIKLVGAGISSDGISIGNGGIYLLGSSADVSNVRFLDNRYGLLYETPVAKSPTNFLKINGCKFEGFYLNAVEASSGSKLGLSILEIMNNIFEDDNINYNTRTYVDIHSADATDGTNYKITDNQFFNRDRPNQNAFQITGIRIINLHKGFIARNLLINEEFSPFYGGSSDGCEDVHWDSNNFTGAGSGATTLTEAGLLVSNSCFCKYSCNEFNQIQYGAYFLDNNDVSVLTHNTFNMNGFAGLGLSQENTATHIGPQDRRNNHWNNSAAHYEYLNFDPGLNSHLSQVERSLFNIQYEEILGTSLWAVPRTIDIVDDVAAHIWFKFKPFLPGDPQPSNPCAPNEYSDPNNDLNDLDYSIINGTFQPWNGYAADTWETSFYLYKRLSDYPTLLTPGSPQETWYNNHYNGTLGKLSRAFADFVDLSLDAPNTIGEQLLNDINSIPVGTTYEQNLKTCLGIFV
ncbi:MAG: hypothetical protein JNJ57_11985, partial [Saprospiraceae bacterium]|nr:hypothetical protein [Saprospiraceae bacterium]